MKTLRISAIAVVMIVLTFSANTVNAQSKKDLSSQLSDIERRVSDLENAKSLLYGKIGAVEKRTTRLEGKVDTLTQMVITLESGLKVAFYEIDTIKSQIKQYANLNSYVQQMRWLKTRVQQQEAKQSYSSIRNEVPENMDIYFVGPFPIGTATLTPAMKASLKKAVSLICQNNDSTVTEINGFASIDGSKEINDSLSVVRADAVYNFLKDEGKLQIHTAASTTVEGLGATVRFGNAYDNRCAVIYAPKKK